MKKLAGLLGAILSLIPASASAIPTPWLKVQGNLLKDPSGNTVVLRGVAVPAPIDLISTRGLEVIDKVAGLHARIIRVPVHSKLGWNAADPEGSFRRHVKPVVDRATANGLYVIIDWHPISDYNSQAVKDETARFWNFMAPKFAKQSNILYEIFNEPAYPDNWEIWKAAAQPWVDIIRSKAPNNIIIVNSPVYSGRTYNACASPFRGTNLMYAAHMYPNEGGFNPSFAALLIGQTSKCHPLIVSEFGWTTNAPNNKEVRGSTSGFGAPFRKYLDNITPTVSWLAWIYDHAYPPKMMIDEKYNLLGGENYMGQFVAQWLKDKRNSNLPVMRGTSPAVSVTPTSASYRGNQPP